MQGSPLAERQQRIISHLTSVDDPALLEAIERLLDDHLSHAKLVPLEEAEVDAILQHLLDCD